MWGVNCLKQDLQDLSDLQDWTSLLPKTPIIELPNYLFKLHLSNIKYTFYSFEADLKTRKYGINPLFDCFHASYLPILMEIGTEVLIPKIA